MSDLCKAVYLDLVWWGLKLPIEPVSFDWYGLLDEQDLPDRPELEFYARYGLLTRSN